VQVGEPKMFTFSDKAEALLGFGAKTQFGAHDHEPTPPHLLQMCNVCAIVAAQFVHIL
jgi:hypothetical protein